MIQATQHEHRGQLASTHAQRQHRHLWLSFLGVLLLIPTYQFGQIMQNWGWVTPLFSDTIVWCIIPYLTSGHLIYRSAHIPVAEQRTLLLINTLVPYLILILAFALFQQRYARSAVMTSALLTTVWFWICEKYLHRQNSLKLLHLDPSIAEQLEQQLTETQKIDLGQIELVYWPEGQALPQECDGAVISDKPALTTAQNEQLATLKLNHIRLYSVAAITELMTGRKSPEILVNPLWQPDGNPAYDTFKRIVDALIVVVTAPGWILLGIFTALLVKLDSPGPALFSQIRTGMHGRPFRIWKFRTMVVQSRQSAQFAQANDRRITRIGQFLRKSRLDEIPQLFNVLIGQMSLIGPRPEQHSFVNEFAIRIPSYPYRHLVRPGITGWAQVMQGYAANEEETSVKLSYDLYYVSHYSLALDLLIVAKTVKTILTGFGAR